MSANEIVLFESSDGKAVIPVEVDFTNNEVWLTRNQLAELFGRDVKTIGKHVSNALSEELAGQEGRVVAKFRQLPATARNTSRSITAWT